MKILALGGTNFIGPPVVRQLSAMGHEVAVFHRGKTAAELPEGIQHLLGDRSELTQMKSEFERLSPQVVVDMFPYTEADAIALMNVFQNIAERVVAISSMDVYRAYAVFLQIESTPVESVPLTENSALRQQLHLFREMAERPLNAPADYEKILVERVVMNYPDLPGTIVRLPMVYGTQDPLNRLFPYLKRMDENRPAIVLPESLAQWRGSYGYVENVAHAIALAATNEHAKGRIYHVADTELTEAERLSRVGRVAGWQGKIVTVATESLPTDWNLPYNTAQHWFVDTTRIRQELGYSEIVSLEQALKTTIDWQRSHPPTEISPWTGKELLDYATEDQILKSI
ncbi:NAD-dependent epimerase/dehydratase family protein [Scytonema millei]|uniref:NAD-dependent epimerase/dehydratase family protein n=1 Tax=Scytonema millei VB511283 TaxID=1245923 RepID=A0A9X5I6D4_9CYAN|nr:NAD-dependent epimerase/dehydratase family protein [Scytonema millei]NHC36614.1 NAD-dependent epimerase/dehydratase family protein [Scytonema millei VB511283]